MSDDVIETLDRPAVGDADRRWRDGCPARFADVSLSGVDVDAAGSLRDWLDQPGCNLLLLGPTGVGKTHAALAAARSWIAKHGRDWQFQPTPELLDAIRPSGAEPDQALHRAIHTPLLVLDDLGGERPTEWTLERLFVIVNRRWLEARPTVATSNLTVADGEGQLVDAVGARTYSRLVQDAVVLQLSGSDRRRDGR